jgi:hypothetical protein
MILGTCTWFATLVRFERTVKKAKAKIDHLSESAHGAFLQKQAGAAPGAYL